MLKQACIAIAISALVLGFGGRLSQAGLSHAGSSLTKGAFSPVILVKKNKKHDDDDDDDDHHGKGKKNKTNDDTSELSECTIQGANSGGGCKNGKWVCEKMKSGKKCCGCVPDKSKGTSAGQSAPSDGGSSSSGGIKPIETPADSLLLPYCEEKNGQWVCTESKGQ